MAGPCTVPNCDRAAYAIGQCNMHYLRYRNHGSFDDPRGTHEERFWSKVDKTDGCWNWTFTKNTYGYGVINLGKRKYMAHRYSYSLVAGPIPDGMVIDHMCYNPSCVNPEHLRACASKQNTENRAGLNRNNTSGVRGVYWDEPRQQWRASVRHNMRRLFIGRFDTIEEAEAAAIARRNELFTHNDQDRVAA